MGKNTLNHSPLILTNETKCLYAIDFCKQFEEGKKPIFIFGINRYTERIIDKVRVNGIIDEYTNKKRYRGIEITPLEKIPNNALVVSTVVGKPLSAEARLSKFKFKHLDYFSFYKYSQLELEEVIFQNGMKEDVILNFKKYEKIYNLLQDKESKTQFIKIINFRKNKDIRHMTGFINKEDQQYFEDFLNLKKNEVFLDIGAYDGFTTETFIKNNPNYRCIHIFEPDKENMKKTKNKLNNQRDIIYHEIGLSNQKKTLTFNMNESCSRISENGETTIKVDKLDNIIKNKVTFIKMDIEGSEGLAIEGAKKIIKKYTPNLAVSVYHKKYDIWKIPEQILKINKNYHLYLRHYTEGIAETVMFFISKDRAS